MNNKLTKKGKDVSESTIENKLLNSSLLNTIEHNNKNENKNNSNTNNSFGKNTKNYSVCFTQILKNDFLNTNEKKRKTEKKLSLKSLSSKSSVSINSENSNNLMDNHYISNYSRGKSNNSSLKQKTYDRLETFEIAYSNNYREHNVSSSKIKIDSIINDSRFFLDDISTKTLNTCSIRNDDFEEEGIYDVEI